MIEIGPALYHVRIPEVLSGGIRSMSRVYIQGRGDRPILRVIWLEDIATCLPNRLILGTLVEKSIHETEGRKDAVSTRNSKTLLSMDDNLHLCVESKSRE